jgi:hypothetical protein
MVIARCLPLPTYLGLRCCPLLGIGRIVVVVSVLLVVAVFVVRGYPLEEIVGPMLVLVAGTVAAADRLVSGGPIPHAPVSATL